MKCGSLFEAPLHEILIIPSNQRILRLLGDDARNELIKNLITNYEKQVSSWLDDEETK